jgi:hypothetical protein
LVEPNDPCLARLVGYSQLDLLSTARGALALNRQDFDLDACSLTWLQITERRALRAILVAHRQVGEQIAHQENPAGTQFRSPARPDTGNKFNRIVELKHRKKTSL